MKPMTKLTIFYDQKCGVCCQVKAWMLEQPVYFPVLFIPFDDPTALEILPELPSLDPAGQIVVAADTGEVYRGADAWITCLWTLRNWAWLGQTVQPPGMENPWHTGSAVSSARIG